MSEVIMKKIPSPIDINKYSLPEHTIVGSIVPTTTQPAYINFGSVKIDCKTGEVTGLSENISEDAKRFWEQVKETILC